MVHQHKWMINYVFLKWVWFYYGKGMVFEGFIIINVEDLGELLGSGFTIDFSERWDIWPSQTAAQIHLLKFFCF